MPRKPSPPPPPQIQALRQRLDRWRETSKPGMRIPDSLWSGAVDLAREFGVHRTAKALRLNYDTLKKRLAETSPDTDGTASSERSAFVELFTAQQVSNHRCLVELENPHGAKMRIHLDSIEAAGLGALAQSFLRETP